LLVTLSLLLLEQFILLSEDEEVVFLHGVELAVLYVAHEFDLGVGSLADGTNLEVLVQQFALNNDR
jgi:hypothetical protein